MELHKENAELEHAFVKLTPPLPFVAEGIGSGFVNAVSSDRIELGTGGDLQMLSRERVASLTICNSDGKTYHYRTLQRILFHLVAFQFNS